MAKTKGRTGTTTAVGDKSNNKKRSAAEEHEEDSKTLKRAKPSVCKAAEELMCPILQGLPIDPVTAEDGQIYEREEIAKYLEKEGNAAISPVTREKFKSKDLVPLVHVRNTIEHLVESGIIEGELADTWKGRMTEKRDGEKEAEKMMRKAEEGDTDAMFELSMAYTRGCHGLKQDFEEAYKWAKKLADSYDAKGMGIAGIMLTIGHGTKANLSEGLILIASSAQQGCTGACSFLAEAYYEGNYGLTKNLRTARYWIEKGLAALGGDYDTGNTDKMHEILRGIDVLEAADTENDANRSDNDGDDD